VPLYPELAVKHFFP
jgi:hypothetical protein